MSVDEIIRGLNELLDYEADTDLLVLTTRERREFQMAVEDMEEWYKEQKK